MPFIDTTPALSKYKVRERTLQDDLCNILIKNGWRKEKTFYKAPIDVWFFGTGRSLINFVVARHTILRNARGDYFGFAIVAQWAESKNNMPSYSSDPQSPFVNELLRRFETDRANTTIYYYTLEKLPNIEDGGIVLPAVKEEDGILRMAVDVEVKNATGRRSVSGSITYTEYEITEADPYVMQSPIIESTIRSKFLENIGEFYKETNWWPDSEISIKGYVDSNNLFLIMQADNAGMWEYNTVPSVPLYFGEIVPFDEGDPAVAMFAGTVPPGSSASVVSQYDFTSTSPAGTLILPILKKYPNHPSNGIDSVIINRTMLGSRYQGYYLSWNTAPNEMPPERISKSGQRRYPRAWPSFDKYRFNPSRYTGKVQTSYLYLVHPEEGVRGYLPLSIGFHPINIHNGEIRIKREYCPERIYDVYQCFPVSAISPLTKRPSTHYYPVGIGIFKEVLNLDRWDSGGFPEELNNVRYEVVDRGVKLLWEVPENGNVSGIEIEVNGEIYAENVSGVNYYLLDLESGEYTVVLRTVNEKGDKSAGTVVEINI